MAIDIKDTTDKVIGIVVEKLDIDPSMVQTSATLQDLGADSLDMVEIVMKVEETFDIEINDEAIAKLHNLQEFINYVHEVRTR